MFKKIAHKSALFLALIVLVAPVRSTFAQSSGGDITTGGDPQPTGEPNILMVFVQAALTALALS